jgi:hypothetical protein
MKVGDLVLAAVAMMDYSDKFGIVIKIYPPDVAEVMWSHSNHFRYHTVEFLVVL